MARSAKTTDTVPFSKRQCPSCGVEWENHTGVAVTCAQKQSLADRVFVCRVLVQLIGKELLPNKSDFTIGQLLKAIRRLKRRAK